MNATARCARRPSWSMPAWSRRSCGTTLERGRRALCHRHHAGHGRADRPERSRRSDRAPVRARSSPNSNATPEERADPIGDLAHSPVEGIVHRYPDRVLLKAVHVCPVYCRFCFRREMVGPQGLGTLSPEAMDAAFAYIARASRDLGGHPHRRRSAGAVARGGSTTIMGRLAGHRAREDRPLPHPRAGGRAGARRCGADRGPQGERQDDLCGAPRQPPARTDACGARRLRPARRCRHRR